IVFVGIENLLRGDIPNARRLVPFGFGLIHGFGFASALREAGIGSGTGGIVLPLFSFNLGVELGQIMVAALALPIIWKLRENRMDQRGELHEDYRENCGALKAADGVCCNCLRAHHRDLIGRIKKGGSDEEILESCFEKGRRLNDGDLFVWTGFASKLGWRDSVTPRLEQRKKEMGIADRNDIQCIPDLIDFDEGRFPEASESP